MLVFIDESGDPGFKVSKGSSPLFAVAMVISADGNAAHQTNRVIVTAKERLRVKPEFKFKKASDRVRDGFFAAVAQCPFTVRAIVVQKDRIYSPHLRADKDDLYRLFCNMGRSCTDNDDCLAIKALRNFNRNMQSIVEDWRDMAASPIRDKRRAEWLIPF
jgi:Protein of unknown function (DUF3800)